MDMFDFNRQMARIKSCFPNSLNDEKIKIIFEKIGDISGNEFSRICERIISTSKYGPSVSDFVEMARPHQFVNDRVVVSLASCGNCDCGIVNAVRKKSNELPYAFRCNCDAGHKRRENYPMWSDRFSQNFEVMNDAYYKRQMLKIVPNDAGPNAS